MPTIKRERPLPHEDFGLRLTLATLLRYRRLAAFVEVLERNNIAKRAAFYYHTAGDKRPASEVVDKYEALLGTPRGWIAKGDGETTQELRDALSALSDREFGSPKLTKLLDLFGLDSAEGTDGADGSDVNGAINHEVTELSQNKATSGIFHKIRHIPLLDDDEIIELIDGRRMPSSPARRTVPLPATVDAGPNCFAYELSADDISMTASKGPSVPPGSICIIDRDAPITPGNYVLTRHKDDRAHMLRRYRAARPYGQATSFALEALHEAFEPIQVKNPKEYEVAGRLIYTLQRW